MSTMLSVSPPLHKDFRTLPPLCSPGDGWRRFNPPPLPTVQPAFHFLSSLLEQPVIEPIVIAPKVRPPMDPALNGTLEKMMKLPLEVLDLIVAHIVDLDSGPSLSLANQFFNRLTNRHLYHSVDLSTHHAVAIFAQTVRDRPDHLAYIKRLGLLCHRPQWIHMHKLGKAFDHENARIKELRVRFQSSDLQEAVPFLSHFNPRSFEWITSPCWLMRPAYLFTQFLSSWKRLECLTFGNFRFDQVIVDCLAVVPSLHSVVLKGNGTSHMDKETLLSLLRLNSIHSEEKKKIRRAALRIQISDFPFAMRPYLVNQIQESLEVTQEEYLTSFLVWG